jgi:hypothetical protein
VILDMSSYPPNCDCLPLHYSSCLFSVLAVWFQVIGTGGAITISACGATNYDGFWFSVYNGAYCDSLECIDGEYDVGEDAEKCTFGSGELPPRPITKFSFNTRDRDRYYIYVHFARTQEDLPTGQFRFFADDGQDGKAGSSGAHLITFEESTILASDGSIVGSNSGSNGNGNGSGNGNGDISASPSISTSLSILMMFALYAWAVF